MGGGEFKKEIGKMNEWRAYLDILAYTIIATTNYTVFECGDMRTIEYNTNQRYES